MFIGHKHHRPTSSQDLSKCGSAHLGFHVTRTGSGYFEVRASFLSLEIPAQLNASIRMSGSGTPVCHVRDESILLFEIPTDHDLDDHGQTKVGNLGFFLPITVNRVKID
jgi:hypothetical protein